MTSRYIRDDSTAPTRTHLAVNSALDRKILRLVNAEDETVERSVACFTSLSLELQAFTKTACKRTATPDLYIWPQPALPSLVTSCAVFEWWRG